MSTRADLTEWLDAAADDTDRVCTFCGEAGWTAAWIGLADVYSCRRCAIEVLPRLIADAVWQPRLRPDHFAALWTEVRAEFWRAIALAAMRSRR